MGCRRDRRYARGLLFASPVAVILAGIWATNQLAARLAGEYKAQGVWVNGTQVLQGLTPIYADSLKRYGQVTPNQKDGLIEILNETIVRFNVQDADLICSNSSAVKSGILKEKYQNRWVAVDTEQYWFNWVACFNEYMDTIEALDDIDVGCRFLSEKVIMVRPNDWLSSLGRNMNEKKGWVVQPGHECVHLEGAQTADSALETLVSFGSGGLSKQKVQIRIGSNLWLDHMSKVHVQFMMRGILGLLLLTPAVFAGSVLNFRRNSKRLKNNSNLVITFYLAVIVVVSLLLAMLVLLDGFKAPDSPLVWQLQYVYQPLVLPGIETGIDVALARMWHDVTSMDKKNGQKKSKLLEAFKSMAIVLGFTLFDLWFWLFNAVFYMYLLPLAMLSIFALVLIQCAVARRLLVRGRKLYEKLHEMGSNGRTGSETGSVQMPLDIKLFLARISWVGTLLAYCSLLSIVTWISCLGLYFGQKYDPLSHIFINVLRCAARVTRALAQILFAAPNELLAKQGLTENKFAHGLLTSTGRSLASSSTTSAKIAPGEAGAGASSK